MAIEQKWEAVPPILFTANGTQYGVVQIADTKGFKVKQLVVLASSTQSEISLQVKRVISSTLLIVGPINPGQGKQSLASNSDISNYLVADNAYIYAAEQSKARLKLDDIEAAVYEQEPTVAKRNILVDPYGNLYDGNNPLPTQNVGSASNKNWDDLVIERDSVTQDIVSITYKKDGNVVQRLDLSYDSNENLIEVNKSSITSP